ncbi:MAG: L-seryl-tRNA(Sec) selenium transferase [Thermodesulfobacteriota bacterium]|nr:L-seryl-tRNA(Sec) selenium transferase [Thermodesulfobacteriota bacterium]
MQELLRRLPAVDQILEEPQVKKLLQVLPRRLILKAVRETLDHFRGLILNGGFKDRPPDLSRSNIVADLEQRALALARPNFRRVVNATGVIIHTNLGRSLLAEEALAAIETAGRYYNNLEFELSQGRRGLRYSHVEGLLCELTGAEAGLIVNNNAAAVLLTLETLAQGREVIVSRGELVEIGGSFRIPDVMARSGAILVEVGTTNKTHLKDYEEAITDRTAMPMKVHQSNFRIVGFTELVEAKDLADLAHSRGLPVIEDLGSGSLVDLSVYGLRKEPTVQETVAAGVDVTTFSGDKLLGGPQAGLIIGRRDIIDRIKDNPLNRALRIDKFTLAALEATLRLYLDEETAVEDVPTLRMITTPYQRLRKRAARLKRKLTAAAGGTVEVGWSDGFSRIGGGALPDEGLKTRLVTLCPLKISVNRLEEWFRSWPTPIIGRIENELFIMDTRTMDDGDFDLAAAALAGLTGGDGS